MTATPFVKGLAFVSVIVAKYGDVFKVMKIRAISSIAGRYLCSILLAGLILVSPWAVADPASPSTKSDRQVETEAPTKKRSARKKLPRVDGITFAVNPGRYYLPVDEAARYLGWQVKHDEGKGSVTLNGQVFSYGDLRRVIEGARLVHMTHLISAGAIIEKAEDGSEVLITFGKRKFLLIDAPQKVKVDLTTQRLKGWQGKRLVLDCHISSGQYGTPKGDYQAGPYKARHHYSRLFNGAPMPYSVQFHGHYFIHGFTSVPDYPASHGCIRMHLDQGNPARFFYEWVKVGTPIQVFESEEKSS